MLENGRLLPSPSTKQVQAKLLALIKQDCSREEVASWAEKWIMLDEPTVDDPVIWRTLDRLSGADMISFERPYLYNETDFRDWLEELRCSEKLKKEVVSRKDDSRHRYKERQITIMQPDLASVVT